MYKKTGRSASYCHYLEKKTGVPKSFIFRTYSPFLRRARVRKPSRYSRRSTSIFKEISASPSKRAAAMFSQRMGGREWMMARNPGEERAACAHTSSCPWRATCGSLVQTLALEPTYVPVAPSPTRPTLYSARLERYRYPYLTASSRTSAPVTHRRSSSLHFSPPSPPNPPFVSPLLRSSSTASPSILSSSIHSRDPLRS